MSEASGVPGGPNAVVAIAIAIGTLYCFLGYRTLKFVIAITGFGLAAGSAAMLAWWISQQNATAVLVCAILGGLCGAAALFFLYRSGVFALGLAGALLVSARLLEGNAEYWAPWAIIAVGIIGGLLALLLERPVITLATASIGAWLVVSGIAFFIIGPEKLQELLKTAPPEEHRSLMLLTWLTLSCAGAIAQFATHRPKAGQAGKAPAAG